MKNLRSLVYFSVSLCHAQQVIGSGLIFEPRFLTISIAFFPEKKETHIGVQHITCCCIEHRF